MPLLPGKYQYRDQQKKERSCSPGKHSESELASPSPLAGFTGKVSKTLGSPGWPLLHLYFNRSLKLHFFSPHMREGPTELISETALRETGEIGPTMLKYQSEVNCRLGFTLLQRVLLSSGSRELLFSVTGNFSK